MGVTVVTCNDGYALQAVVFEPRGERRSTVIVCPAIFVARDYYARFAADLARRGHRVVIYDNRGVGESLRAETRPWEHRLRDWGERDLPAVIAWARSTGEGDRLFVVGHSMGGQVVALSEAVHQLTGIVTVAATAAWWGNWPFPTNLGILGWYCLVPVIGRAIPKFPADRLGLGPDVSSALVRDWARWGRHPRYLLGPFGMRPHMHAYRGRLLVYSFTDDRLASHRAVRSLHASYTSAEVRRRRVDPATVGAERIGHFGFFRPRVGGRLWEETAAWLG